MLLGDKSKEEEKKEAIEKYIKSLATIEMAMEPLKEQKKALRQNYIENGWLSREEISTSVKAYRFLKNKLDIDEFNDFYNKIAQFAKEQ